MQSSNSQLYGLHWVSTPQLNSGSNVTYNFLAICISHTELGAYNTKECSTTDRTMVTSEHKVCHLAHFKIFQINKFLMSSTAIWCDDVILLFTYCCLTFSEDGWGQQQQHDFMSIRVTSQDEKNLMKSIIHLTYVQHTSIHTHVVHKLYAHTYISCIIYHVTSHTTTLHILIICHCVLLGVITSWLN